MTIVAAFLLAARYGLQARIDFQRAKQPALSTAHLVPSTDLIALLWGVCVIIPILRMFLGYRLGPGATVGFVCICAGSTLGLLGIVTLGRSYSRHVCLFENHRLVTEGVYSVIRHPIRLGMILEAIGFAALLPLGFASVAPLVFATLLNKRGKHEDSFLREHFGAIALEYQARTPSFNIAAGMYRCLRKYCVPVRWRAHREQMELEQPFTQARPQAFGVRRSPRLG
ncbi:MAG TPA: isoprenylcysteine carboxylmethyltransferase family protein [Verrucomicrobiae bacterium]|nr:isoprenylcysteine carboxylmethyltransferase family protein [Verrucomicrobiae bacterium]